eukprot:16227_6
MSLSNAIHLLQARTQLAHEHLFEDVRLCLINRPDSCRHLKSRSDRLHADLARPILMALLRRPSSWIAKKGLVLSSYFLHSTCMQDGSQFATQAHTRRRSKGRISSAPVPVGMSIRFSLPGKQNGNTGGFRPLRKQRFVKPQFLIEFLSMLEKAQFLSWCPASASLSFFKGDGGGGGVVTMCANTKSFQLS